MQEAKAGAFAYPGAPPGKNNLDRSKKVLAMLF
jgi:hypothetical protein